MKCLPVLIWAALLTSCAHTGAPKVRCNGHLRQINAPLTGEARAASGTCAWPTHGRTVAAPHEVASTKAEAQAEVFSHARSSLLCEAGVPGLEVLPP